jgi:hypothetical protein
LLISPLSCTTALSTFLLAVLFSLVIPFLHTKSYTLIIPYRFTLAFTHLVELAEGLYCEDSENNLDSGQRSLGNHLLVCLEGLVALG